jgi:hypothetical protein
MENFTVQNELFIAFTEKTEQNESEGYFRHFNFYLRHTNCHTRLYAIPKGTYTSPGYRTDALREANGELTEQ